MVGGSFLGWGSRVCVQTAMEVIHTGEGLADGEGLRSEKGEGVRSEQRRGIRKRDQKNREIRKTEEILFLTTRIESKLRGLGAKRRQET